MTIASGILLKWQDNSEYEQGFRVYRSDTPINKNALPPVLATLPENTTAYLDESVELNRTYYYAVSTFFKSKEFFAEDEIEANTRFPVIGEFYGGGYCIGSITIDDDEDQGTYAIIMAEPAGQSSSRQWKTGATATAGTTSLDNGLRNTLAMIANNEAAHPAAAHCHNYDGGGFNDWYLPSKAELQLYWTNRAELAALSISGSSYYWTSTQDTTANAWRQYMSNGAQASASKTTNYAVRPVRRVRIFP